MNFDRTMGVMFGGTVCGGELGGWVGAAVGCVLAFWLTYYSQRRDAQKPQDQQT